MNGERCETCDRYPGWENDPHGDVDGCECDKCCALCWGGPQCMSGEVDWRARALQAEKQRDALIGFIHLRAELADDGKESVHSILCDALEVADADGRVRPGSAP